MLVRFIHFITALLAISALAVIYNNIVTPRMQPPRLNPVAMSKGFSERDNGVISDLFPEGAWQRGNCKQLQTSEAMLLFENWQQTADDQWKLWPITVVIGRGMSGVKTAAPVIIEAAEGADITFAESLDVMSGGAPPIRHGRMIGPVHIHRHSSDDQRSFDIRTANVRIDNKKIWTTDTIEMQVGGAQLVGRDLTIHLAGSTAPGHDVAILERLELIYLDKLVMPLERGGLWKGDAAVSNQLVTTAPSEHPAIISIQCGGRVEYDFTFDELHLHESVSLVHHVRGALADRFECTALKLKLNDPSNDSIERDGPLDWLVEIVATGSPAVATLPSFDAELAAERIEFHAIKGLIHAEGSRGVRVKRAGITARLARLIYQFDPQRPTVLGAIDAEGAGIVHFDDPNIPLRRTQWENGLRMEPVGVATAANINTNVNVQINGNFHAWLSDGGEFKADSVFAVLTPDQQATAESNSSLVPHYCEVKGGVEIDTTAVRAQTQLLTLHFVAEADPRPQTAADQTGAGPSPLRQWVTQPKDETHMVDPIARPRPTIQGDTIRALMRRNKGGVSVKDLSVTGSVKVLHQLQTGGQSLPAKLTGEEMRLKDAGGEDVLQLGSGPESPARFQLGDGFFIGPQIQIRPADNVVWMRDAGEFQMPTAALPTGLAGDADAKIEWVKAPHCTWQGQMIFDGRTAVLSDGVQIQASLLNGLEPWDLNMTGDQLRVDLLEDVRVRDMQTMRAATLKQVSLLQSSNRPVMVQAIQRTPDGVMEAKHVIHAARLTLSPVAGGKLVGDGPGSYRGWMRPQNDGPFFGSGKQGRVATANSELTGIHLVFNEAMQGDMTSRNLDFLRGVRVATRPVRNWEEAFDAKAMDAISMGDATLDCDRLRFSVEPGFDAARRVPGAPVPWEMEATSGVVFRTRNERGLLAGTASRAAYSSSKDLFTVEGAPNRAATFQQTLQDGSKGPEGAVKTMSIRPRTMKIENLVLERFNIATPPRSPRR